ncbi:hypothetical protein [Actinomadura sp. 9N407]|uniref:hypothetical protein n=1 Tax=Actinomadura sp. 9N407 TaxID=3375154 RepID=UPI0037B79BCD
MIAPNPKVAEWCAEPIDLGHPGYVLCPMVVKSEHIPLMTDPYEIAADYALGVLSACFHSEGPSGREVLLATQKATDLLAAKNMQIARRYYDDVCAVIPTVVRTFLEEKMKTESPYFSEVFRDAEARGEAKGEARGEARGMARGMARGEAKALLKLLDLRGIQLTGEQRERIAECTDTVELESMLERALKTDSAAELFSEDPHS